MRVANSSGRTEDGKWISAAAERHELQRRNEGHDRKVHAGTSMLFFAEIVNLHCTSVVGNSANLLIRKLRTQGFDLRWKVEIYRKSATSLESFRCNIQKNTVLRFNASIDLGRLFMKYNTPLRSFFAVERLFSMGAAILAAKWVSLTSKNFQRLVFLKENLVGKGFAQDDFDDMPSTSRK